MKVSSGDMCLVEFTGKDGKKKQTWFYADLNKSLFQIREIRENKKVTDYCHTFETDYGFLKGKILYNAENTPVGKIVKRVSYIKWNNAIKDL